MYFVFEQVITVIIVLVMAKIILRDTIL